MQLDRDELNVIQCITYNVICFGNGSNSDRMPDNPLHYPLRH